MTRSASIVLAGDVMLGRGVNVALKRFGPDYPWGNMLSLVRSADLTIINLECVISQGGQPWSRWPKVFHFKADPIAMDSLALAGVDAVELANNHVLDYEEDALLEMLDLLDQGGIAYAGAGRNAAEANRPALVQTGVLKVGLVSLTDNEPGWAATEEAPGTNWLRVSTEEQSLAPVREGIRLARSQRADLVIVSNHWGPNMVQRPPALFREFAHAVVDVGADVYHGHSAHIFQGVEIYKGRPIIYDSGDFIDDYAIDPELRNDWSLLFWLQVEEGHIRRVELIPALISFCQVNLATGATRDSIVERICRLSAEMGTTVQTEDEQLRIELPSTSRAGGG